MPSADLVRKVLNERYKGHIFTWFNNLKFTIDGNISAIDNLVLVKIEFTRNGENVHEPITDADFTRLKEELSLHRILRYLGRGEFIVVLDMIRENALVENGYLSYEQSGMRVTAL